jgi:cytochrome c oxidase subunit 2
VPKQTHGHTPLEIGWTVAFAVILLIFAIPTIRSIFRTQEAPAATALRIEVAGKQWWWEFRYPGLKIATANELHLPAGQTVAFHLNAPDVIHSFWIPQLGGKRDVVPHRVNRLVMTPDTPGEFPGQCAEYCGESHANMRFRVVVHKQEDFERWVKAQQAPPVEPTDPLAQQGKALFAANACVGCHTIGGTSAGQIGPDLTHFGSRKTLGANLLPNTPENLIRWIENPGHVKPGNRMPDLGMRGEQSKALAAYLQGLK